MPSWLSVDAKLRQQGGVAEGRRNRLGGAQDDGAAAGRSRAIAAPTSETVAARRRGDEGDAGAIGETG